MHITRKQLILIIADIILVGLAIYSAHIIRFSLVAYRKITLIYVIGTYTGATIFAIMMHLMTFYIFELYDVRIEWKSLKGFLRVLGATFLASIVIVFLYFFLPHWKFGRGIVAIHAIFVILLIYSWRVLFQIFLPVQEPEKKVLILGSGEPCKEIITLLKNEKEKGYKIVCIIDYLGNTSLAGVEINVISRDDASISEIVKKEGVDLIVVAIEDNLNDNLVTELLECKTLGIRLKDMPTLYKEISGKVPVMNTQGSWFLFGPDFDKGKRGIQKNIWRMIDFGFGIVGLIVALPLLFVCAVLIKFTSKDPVFFRQVRLGYNEKPFTLIKLRTMHQDAERNGPQWAKENDPRVTPIGKFLRRSRLDELPQLWNILKGDMSIIGPRPERPEFVKELKRKIPYYGLRFAIKPGLTGWAQVNYKYGSSVEDALKKLQYELYYIQERSFILDMLIIIKTIQTVILRPGS